MAKRGRTPGFKMSEEHRAKISKSQIFRNLLLYAEGKEVKGMDKARADVGLALMKKVLPDLSTVTIEGGEEPLQVTQIGLVAVSPDESED